ncbi:MAG: glycosyltransferase, partial [Pseudomonadota bacterium]
MTQPSHQAPPPSPNAAPGALRTLAYTTLFPNDRQPGHGIFIEHRLRRQLEGGLVHPRVVAPVPWFPSRHPRFGRYAEWAQVCRRESRFGLEVSHPRYPTIPRVGMHIAPSLLALATWRHTAGVARAAQSQLLDAHYLYPDGVAAAWLANRLRLPLVLSARGSDANVLTEFPLPRRMIVAATRRASAVVCVSDALRNRLSDIGVADDKLLVLRNGVDLDGFAPMARDAARLATGIRGRSLLCVGNLLEAKGHHLVIEALQQLPDDVSLTIVGAGPFEKHLRELADRLAVASRVHFAGRRPQSELRAFYSATDIFVLASQREGLPNVVLE